MAELHSEMSSGMDMIRNAAEVASLSLDKHYNRVWLQIDQRRIKRVRFSQNLLKLHVDNLFKDTEEVINHIWGKLA